MNRELKRPMKRQPLSLRPHDVCVLLQFALKPEMTFRDLSDLVGLSLGEVHNATNRLVVSRLVPPGGGAVNQSACFDFLVSGVPYVFPGEFGAEVRGVPTAHSGPILREQFPEAETVVWPSAQGAVRGLSLSPLCQNAPKTATANPALYEWLTVVDSLRIGRARERTMAREFLEQRLLGQGRNLQ